jgi:hypothetical protein
MTRHDRRWRPLASGAGRPEHWGKPHEWHPTVRVLDGGFETGSGRMPVLVQTVLLLLLSNVFMTFAWYAHLKELRHRPWYVAALVSWGLALFEYLAQVPANRIGHAQMSVGQLKILQEVITLSVFVPFSIFYLHEPIRLNYLWAGLCLCGAVYFVFRG